MTDRANVNFLFKEIPAKLVSLKCLSLKLDFCKVSHWLTQDQVT